MPEEQWWRAAAHQDDAQRQRTAGAELMKWALTLYATSKISAKDFAIGCHWAQSAGVTGADFSMYAVAPGRASDGDYQSRLDKVLPMGVPLLYVNVPCMPPGAHERAVRVVPVAAAYEAPMW